MADAGDGKTAKNRSPLDWKRREFLKRVGMIGAGVAITDLILQHSDEQVEAAQTNASQTSQTMQLQGETSTIKSSTSSGEIPRRQLGSTGVEVSALTLGGYHIGTVKSEQEAVRIIHEAMDAGVTFMDNAWEYNDGRSEQLMGLALQALHNQVMIQAGKGIVRYFR